MALISSRSGAADTGTHRRSAGKKQQHYCKDRKQLRQRPNPKNNNNKNKPIFSYMPANNEAVVWIQDALQKPWFEPALKFCFAQLLLLHSRLDEGYVFKKKKQSKKNTHIQADEDQVCVRSSESRQPIRSAVEMSSLKTTSWSSNKKQQQKTRTVFPGFYNRGGRRGIRDWSESLEFCFWPTEFNSSLPTATNSYRLDANLFSNKNSNYALEILLIYNESQARL